MLGSQSVLALAALGLAVLTATGTIAVWHVIAIAMVAGTASALWGPSMQAVIPTLVAPEQLLNAISLNSVQFNLARTLGPAIAGTVYARIGPAGCFLLNSAGFVVLTAALARVHLPHRPAAAPPPIGRALRDGLGYARRHAVIGPALLLSAVMSVFGFPYIILLPALARDALGLDASGLGYLMASVGAGAVSGGLSLSAAGNLPRKGLVAGVSALLFGAVLAAFAVVRTVPGVAILLFVMGILQTICVASLNTTIQMVVHDGMRGRVMSMVTVILFGFATTGSLLIGLLGDRIGVALALSAGGVVIMVAAVGVLLRATELLAAPRSAAA
jgi:predicted MFS family arabinose efflux permease